MNKDHGTALAEIHAATIAPIVGWSASELVAMIEASGVSGFLHCWGGFILIRITAVEAEILLLAVHPIRQREGIATELVNCAMKVAARRNGREMWLEVSPTNRAALTLYETCGFGICGFRRPGYYPDGAGAVIMRQSLTPCNND